MAGGEIIRLPIDKQRKCPPAAAAAEPGANYAVMIALLFWTSQATVPVMSLHLPHLNLSHRSAPSGFPHLRIIIILWNYYSEFFKPQFTVFIIIFYFILLAFWKTITF